MSGPDTPAAPDSPAEAGTAAVPGRRELTYAVLLCLAGAGL
ncbi:Trp biosynthesis protein, partial [Micromonospora sp. 4G55]|nr:Trp biosynthesis protein [Micromonospora sp. 4G55]